ncbi:hypothetical protein KIH27_01535 [Mycobacterium sp. M1]|uniref:CopG family transcriptional regulator n=1 Tax=Mycolicibacter acidiphilus TaxID=2835306 RepID=A0ABS5RDB4_9MYCO|nr:hypothetical protein [Mycolicibacter acidiphilus]MBS9532267.1 hypothetical protein [Mycolicibacter acidiphilus]
MGENKPGLDELLAEAITLEDGTLPDVRPTRVSRPNLPKSEVVHVRLAGEHYRELKREAELRGISVSDVVRTATFKFLHQRDDDRSADYLAEALRQSGLRVVSSRHS